MNSGEKWNLIFKEKCPPPIITLPYSTTFILHFIIQIKMSSYYYYVDKPQIKITCLK